MWEEYTDDGIVQMINIMQLMSEGENGSAVAKTRVAVLSNYL